MWWYHWMPQSFHICKKTRLYLYSFQWSRVIGVRRATFINQHLIKIGGVNIAHVVAFMRFINNPFCRTKISVLFLPISDNKSEDIVVVGALVANGHLPSAGCSELWNGIDHDDLQRTKIGNKARKFEDAFSTFSRKYFAESSTYDKNDSERRFRMPRNVLYWIKDAMLSRSMFALWTINVRKKGVRPLVRIVASSMIFACEIIMTRWMRSSKCLKLVLVKASCALLMKSLIFLEART